jgi:hypothetical protein
MTSPIRLPEPVLQIDFSWALARLRDERLQDALARTVRAIDIASMDRELAEYVIPGDLAALASCGLRGELLFAVPCLLATNPKLLGYYRLLLGFSQKEFYGSAFGTASFKVMEEAGRLSPANADRLPDLCHALTDCASGLLAGIGAARISRELLDDLTLLTLGPQMRGGANVRKGTRGIDAVFHGIHAIVQDHVETSGSQKIELTNAAGRRVVIAFAADPDIIIRERMTESSWRNIIAIEIKGGTDYSNIHNRLGEAEKSHQKARQAGFVECWTIVNVHQLNMVKAAQESPSTNRFYRIDDIVTGSGDDYTDFRNRLISLTGIPARRGD